MPQIDIKTFAIKFTITCGVTGVTSEHTGSGSIENGHIDAMETVQDYLYATGWDGDDVHGWISPEGQAVLIVKDLGHRDVTVAYYPLKMSEPIYRLAISGFLTEPLKTFDYLKPYFSGLKIVEHRANRLLLEFTAVDYGLWMKSK